MFNFLHSAFVTAIFVYLVPFAAYSQPQQGTQPAPRSEEAGASDPATITALYYAGKDDAVVKKVDVFFRKHQLTNDNLQFLFFQAASYYRLGKIDNVIRAYDRSIPVIEKLNNVLQRRYAFVFFRLGLLHRQQRQYDVAIKCVEAGLLREPQNSYYQILLGELYRERGDRSRALKHFDELVRSSVLTSEEKTVVQIKLDRLNPEGVGSSVPRVEMAHERFYPGLSFGIAPLNYSAPKTALYDICVLLESKWLVRCEVLPLLSLEEDKILDRERKQYSGERILDELKRRYPAATRRPRNVIALVGEDLFGSGTSYVFSWQSPGEGVGVVSARRFLNGLEDFYEPQTVVIRRLGIQFISATSSMLGFRRAIRADCPTAYPNDFREFQQKGSRLCESTVRQRDEVLKTKGGTPGVVGAEKNEMINHVYRTYYFE